MRYGRRGTAFGVVVAGVLALTSPAFSATLSATSVGSYRNSGDDTADTKFGGALFTAWNPNFSGNENRSFAVFDLSLLVGQVITGAAFHTFLDAQSGYNSPNPTETIDWVQVTTSPATVASSGYSDAIWQDLGDGTVYGTK